MARGVKRFLVGTFFIWGMGALVWADTEIPASVDPAIVAASMEPLPAFKSARRDFEDSKNNSIIDDTCLELKKDEYSEDPIVIERIDLSNNNINDVGKERLRDRFSAQHKHLVKSL